MPPARRPTALALGLLASLGLLLAAPLAAQPMRLGVDAFGSEAQIEVWGLPTEQATTAIHAALRQIGEVAGLTAPAGAAPGSVGALNAAAGAGQQTVDPRVADLLRRALLFCYWSDSAFSPVAGGLNRLWTVAQETRQPIAPADLRVAVGGSDCSRLTLGGGKDGAPLTVALAAGSLVDVTALAPAYAVDRALEVLKEQGATNAIVELGPVRRALGPGLEGKGWRVRIPPAPGEREPLDEIFLVDQSMSYRFFDDDGDGLRPALDHRTGVPARGTVAVAAVAELAIEAEGLTQAIFVLGRGAGHRRLGALKPRPSVYWLLGDGNGKPVEASYNWSDLAKVRRKRR